MVGGTTETQEVSTAKGGQSKIILPGKRSMPCVKKARPTGHLFLGLKKTILLVDRLNLSARVQRKTTSTAHVKVYKPSVFG